MHMTTMTARYVISPDVCSTTDDDGTTILSVRLGKVFGIKGIGSLIWNKLTVTPGGLAIDTIVDELQSDFNDMPREEIMHDVEDFVNSLNRHGIIQASYSDNEGWMKIAGRYFNNVCISLATLTIDGVLTLRLYVLASFLLLFTVDLILKLRGFRALHSTVQWWPRRSIRSSLIRLSEIEIIAAINTAVDRACTIYPKHALCLQRSAVGACLLRSCGVAAQMVVGCHKMPFYGHAWVEVEGEVINDLKQVQESYSVLDRC
jgi:transglutaminase superfamily protein/coenzyme PQQ synthesis protein D (PqqD)